MLNLWSRSTEINGLMGNPSMQKSIIRGAECIQKAKIFFKVCERCGVSVEEQ